MRCPNCDKPLTDQDLPHDDNFKCPHCGHEIHYDVPGPIYDPEYADWWQALKNGNHDENWKLNL